MSRYARVKPKRKDHQPRTPAAKPSAQPAPDRSSYAAEMRETLANFVGLPMVQEVIDYYLATIRAHRVELAERQSLPPGTIRENYRWDVAPGVAIRAARALLEALDKREQLRGEVEEMVAKLVAQKFGATWHYTQPGDTAVTQPADEPNTREPQKPPTVEELDALIRKSEEAPLPAAA